jgi:hypothetical protein
MESSRPHYAASWPPILHAAALWLNASGFDSRQSNASLVPNNNSSVKAGDSPSDRFHLLFGECNCGYNSVWYCIADESHILEV